VKEENTVVQLAQQLVAHKAVVEESSRWVRVEKTRKEKSMQAAKHSLHQLSKRRHIGLKCCESPPPGGSG
jgi:hypothetical protein